MPEAAVDLALQVALQAHAGQERKHSRVPYAVHPLHVALIVARWGGDADAIQAALLHDVVEDCPGWTHERVRADFGGVVAGVVAELTEDKSRTWEERKEAGIARVAALSERALAVKAADKLHNLLTLAHALRGAADRARVWASFNGGRDRTLDTDRRLVAALRARLAPGPAAELERALAAIEAAA